MATTTSNRSAGRSWKLERAGVRRKQAKRSRSNKYSSSDEGERPRAGSRQRVWIGAYERADGTRVAGHYRALR